MKVNLSDLADVMGVSLPTVRAWIKKGLPYEQEGTNGKEWIFETADAIQWKLNDELSRLGATFQSNPTETNAQELKRRRLEAETIIAELDQEKKVLELAEKKGYLVFIDDANAAIVDAVTTLRQRLLTIPRRVTPLVLGETDDRIVCEKIEQEIADALGDVVRAYENEVNEIEKSYG